MAEQRQSEARREGAWSPLFSSPVLAGALLIAAAILLQPMLGQPPRAANALIDRVGSLQAVTLTNGQVYFGTLKSVIGGDIVLGDVFEAVTAVNQQTNQRTTQLAERRVADWHGPTDMVVPADKLLFTETVGATSTVAKTIGEALTKK